MTEPRRIAVVHDYREFVEALDARAAELQISRETIDAVAGLQSGYSGKALVWPPVRKLGRVSLGPLLEVLGLTLVIVENPEALERLKHRLTARNESQVRRQAKLGYVEIRLSRKKLRQWGSLGGKKRAANLTRRKRERIARKAGKARARLAANPAASRAPGRTQSGAPVSRK